MLQLDLLDLGIKPVVKHTFDNYIASESNQQIIAHLNYLIRQPENIYLYLWGSSGVGKSHLLHAVCEAAVNKNLLASYFSFSGLINNNLINLANILENLELQDIICLDDLDILVNNSYAEELLFGFYNRIKDANKVLIIASKCSVLNLKITLPDLRSRLAAGISYNLKAIDDQDKKNLLKTRANERGMTLSDDIATYLITRGKRDITGLFEMLDKLDKASMRYKRKLTVRFAKEVLF